LSPKTATTVARNGDKFAVFGDYSQFSFAKSF